MTSTPASLLQRLREPDRPDAWATFVELYTPFLFHWARRLGLQEADAADLVQDVFAALLPVLPTFHYEPGKSFRGYLRTVAVNAWKKRQRHPPAQPLDAAPEPAAVDGDGFEEAEYRLHLLGRSLARLQAEFEPLTWRAWQRFAVEGHPAAAVAAELHVTVNAVYLAKSHVLRRLRQELAGLLD